MKTSVQDYMNNNCIICDNCGGKYYHRFGGEIQSFTAYSKFNNYRIMRKALSKGYKITRIYSCTGDVSCFVIILDGATV